MEIIKHFNFLYEDVLKCLKTPQRRTGHIIGGRWSGKSKSVLILLAQTLFLNDTYEHKDKVIQVNWFRQDVYSADENFAGFCDTLNELGVMNKVYLHKTKRIATYKNVQVRFIGYETSKNKSVAKLGLNRLSNVTLLINVFEEIFEFKGQRDIDKITQAVGSGQSVLTYFLTNPWDENHWYLFQLSKLMYQERLEFNVKQMDKKGYNFFRFKNGDYLSWTNHKVNHYLSKLQHQDLIDYWKRDPEQAKIVERGEMGLVLGGIYKDALRKSVFKVPKIVLRGITKLWMGVDVGVVRDATAFSLVGANKDNSKFVVLSEFYHSHKHQWYTVEGKDYIFVPKDQSEYVRLIVAWANTWSNRYNLPIDIFVDYSSNLTNFVRNEIEKLALNDHLQVFPCHKVRVSIRIDATVFLLLNQRLFINRSQSPHLVREMKGSSYKESLQTQHEHDFRHYNLIRNDGNDHVLNAFEYAMGQTFYEVRDTDWNQVGTNEFYAKYNIC